MSNKARYFGDIDPDNWWYRSIHHLAPDAVVDANVLVDAALIVDGLGWFVLRQLIARRVVLHTTLKSIEEAKEVIRKHRPTLPDATMLIEYLVDQAGFTVHANVEQVPGINKHDSHLAAVARNTGGFVLTEDTPLLLELDRARLHGRSLREVAMALIAPEPPDIKLGVFGMGAGADGHILIKFTAHPDLATNVSRHWYLFDVQDLAMLRYNGVTKAFEILFDTGHVVSLATQLEPEVQYAFLLNYSIGRKTQVDVRLHIVGRPNELRETATISALPKRPNGAATWLNNREKKQGWAGSLEGVTFGPYRLNRKVWRACHSLVGVLPPTHTSGMTLAAAILTAIEGDKVRRPPLAYVLALANATVPVLYPGRLVDERTSKLFK